MAGIFWDLADGDIGEPKAFPNGTVGQDAVALPLKELWSVVRNYPRKDGRTRRIHSLRSIPGGFGSRICCTGKTWRFQRCKTCS